MNDIVISEVNIVPIKPRNGLVAFASCLINKQFYLGGIAIHTSPSSESGFRLVYPVKTLVTGKEIHCFHPITREAGDVLNMSVVGKFQELMEKAV